MERLAAGIDFPELESALSLPFVMSGARSNSLEYQSLLDYKSIDLTKICLLVAICGF